QPARRLDRLAAAITQYEPFSDSHLAAARVSAEIVVVVQDQNARVRPLAQMKERRGQPAEACADYYKVHVAIAWRALEREASPVAQGVRDGAGRFRAAAPSGLGGRISARIRRTQPAGGREARADRNREAVQKIAPGDGVLHSSSCRMGCFGAPETGSVPGAQRRICDLRRRLSTASKLLPIGFGPKRTLRRIAAVGRTAACSSAAFDFPCAGAERRLDRLASGEQARSGGDAQRREARRRTGCGRP